MRAVLNLAVLPIGAALAVLLVLAGMYPLGVMPLAHADPSAGVRSELISVTLPPGTVPACCGKYAGQEVWLVTTPYDYTVQSLRQQLPIKQPYEGVPWCNQEINGKLGFTEWDWMDNKNIIQVHILRQPDDEGRYGCDTP